MTLTTAIHGVIVGLSLASIYVLMALGLTLMFGILGIINLSHGVMYMLGAFGIYYIYGILGLNFYLAMLLTIATLGLVGLFMERTLYRPSGGGFAPVIVITAALMMVLESTGYLAFGTVSKGVSTPIVGSVTMLGLPISYYRLVIMAIAAILVAALYYLIQRTAIGCKMRAVEENRVAAALQGINANRINALVFFLGIALAGAAGALVAPIYSIDPSIGGLPMVKAFMVIILGGMGSVPGAILGAIVIGLADSLLAIAIGSEFAYILTWLLIIAILLIRPRGLLGAY